VVSKVLQIFNGVLFDFTENSYAAVSVEKHSSSAADICSDGQEILDLL
jgi:hypothetical protein